LHTEPRVGLHPEDTTPSRVHRTITAGGIATFKQFLANDKTNMGTNAPAAPADAMALNNETAAHCEANASTPGAAGLQ